MRRWWLPLLLVVLWTSPAGAHPVALSADVSPDTVEMASHLTYTVFAEWPAGWNVTPPRPEKKHPSFAIVGCAKPIVTEPAAGRYEMRLSCDLVAFNSGRIELPAWPIKIISPTGEEFVDSAPSVSVDIVAPLVGEQPLPLKPQELVRRDWLKILLYAIGGALAGALLVGLIFLLARAIYRKLSGRQKATPAEPIEPADERALRRLGGPELAALLAGEDAKAYFSELTDIVREYLEGRFHVRALELTTTETLQELRDVDLQGHELFLRDLLTVADLAKFAGVGVEPGRWARDRDRARQMVEDTKPQPEPAADETGEAA
ncbi:MAG: hypothetical protein P9L99_12720 [Candidatus Lernaella stagnicola]|nr:hypothetical protein [Candidatus Lernaella stagnicola]